MNQSHQFGPSNTAGTHPDTPNVMTSPSYTNYIDLPTMSTDQINLLIPPVTPLKEPIQFNLINPLQTSVLSPPPITGFTSTLISMPGLSTTTTNDTDMKLPDYNTTTQRKRSSMEMEDELTTKEAPPTKQQLSESKLFKRFGSLQIGNTLDLDNAFNRNLSGDPSPFDDADDEADDDDNDEETIKCKNIRRDFDRYVYLLFKDKKSNSGNFPQLEHSGMMDRLIRDEREKLSKAVILWTPPVKYNVELAETDSDEEEFKYNDHRDFLKSRRKPAHKPAGDSSSSSQIIITEINDTECSTQENDSDDVMQIE